MKKYEHASSCWYGRQAIYTNGIQKESRFTAYIWIPAVSIWLRQIAGMTVLCMVFSFSAYAEEKSTVCRVLAAHKPIDNVIYQAGVDVHGKAVVPADLNAAPNFMPEVIKVPLEIDLVKRMAYLTGKDIVLDAPLGNGVGMIEIHQDGTVRYGDQDWTAPVMTLCGQSHKVPHKVVEAEDGQMPSDTIKSPAVEKPAEAPIRIITNRPELIEGGAYR